MIWSVLISTQWINFQPWPGSATLLLLLYSDWLYILPRVANEHKDTPTRPPLSFPFPSFEVTNLCWFKKKGSFYPKILYQVSLSLCTLLLRFFSDLKNNLSSNKLSEMSAKPSNSSHVDCRNLNKKSAFISARRIPLIFFYFNPYKKTKRSNILQITYCY